MTGFLDILYPPSCAACGKVLETDGFFCTDCAEQVEPLPAPRCGHCAEPGDFRQDACPRCRLYPPPFTRAFAPFAHEGAVARAIHLFKYEDHPELARPLAALAAREAANFLESAPPRVCALPLHVRRYRERRYDQAALLAVELCRLSGKKPLRGALERRRETKRQVGLSEREREENVEGAFAAFEEVRGETVLLVDDVFTTGATARAAASALLQAGAAEVQVFTLARAFSSP